MKRAPTKKSTVNVILNGERLNECLPPKVGNKERMSALTSAIKQSARSGSPLYKARKGNKRDSYQEEIFCTLNVSMSISWL